MENRRTSNKSSLSRPDSLARRILQNAARLPEKIAVIEYRSEGVREINYGALLAAACRTAENLSRLGFPPGARVALSGEKSAGWVAACLGIHLAGFTVAPLDPEAGEEQLSNILSFLVPSAAFCESKLTGIFSGLAHRFALETIDFSPAQTLFEPKPLSGDQPFSIVFTSGSTATPKGVMLTEENFLHNVQTLLAAEDAMRESDRLLNLLPLHHVYPFTGTLLTPLCAGATIIYPRSLKPVDISRAAMEQRATVMVVVPRVLQSMHTRIFSAVEERSAAGRILFRLLFRLAGLGIERGLRPGRHIFPAVHRSLPALRYFACGGARLDAGIHRDLAALGFRILEAYGLSETAPLVTLNSIRRPVFGSVGKPAPGVELKLERIDKSIEDAEVLVRGPNVMAAYWRLPEETKKAFRQGWFRTGDLGKLDREGNLFLSGRTKEVIVMPSGKNIYPEELERIYGRSELVEEVCICLLKGDKKEHLTAVVVLSRETLQQRRIANIYEEIKFEIENLAVGLPSYQRVTKIILRQEPFPRTRLGKLKRYQIAEQIEGGGAGVGEADKPQAAQSEESADELLKFTRDKLKLKKIPSGRENLELDLGMDSLTKIDFLSSFESRFGVSLSDEQAGAVLALDDLRAFIGRGDRTGKESEPAGSRQRDVLVPLEELVELKESPWGKLVRWLARAKLRFLFRLFFRARISGLENIPKEGAYIIAPNHLSYIDGLLIHAMVPRRVSSRLFSLGTAEILDRWPFSQISYRARIIKTGTLETTTHSLAYAEQVLFQGSPLCLFPEGKRSIDGKVDVPRPGTARLALGCRVPLVPVYIRGAEKLLSRMHPGLRLAQVSVEILPIIPPEGTEQELLEHWLSVMRAKEESHEA